MNSMEALNRRRKAQKTQAPAEEKKKSYHPRELYRGLTVAYSTAPGRKRIHPKGKGGAGK